MKTTKILSSLLAILLTIASTPNLTLASDADWKESDLFTDSRWTFNPVGSGAGGEYEKNEAARTLILKPSKWTKLADSEDGFVYYYTEVDPSTENFIFTATFTVDEAAADTGEVADNQTGFGIIAVDDLLANDSPARYFNSAAAAVGRYVNYKGGNKVHNGIPGGRFVKGYTGPLTEGVGRDLTSSKAFEWSYNAGYPTSYKFKQGDSYTFTLRRSGVGFHASLRGMDGEIISYDDDGENPLLMQDKDKYYVGVFASRKAVVSVSDITFKTIHPSQDEKFPPRPTEYVEKKVRFDSAASSGVSEYAAAFVPNFNGAMSIRGADGRILVSDVPVEKNKRFEVKVPLRKGLNEFNAEFSPFGKDRQSIRSHEELDSYDALDMHFAVTHKQYGTGENAVYVSPNGLPDNPGTQADPIDLHSAIEFAQPGQQIVLLYGIYRPTRGLMIARGNNGLPHAPITLMGEPGTIARLDMSRSQSGALTLSGDYWHVYGLEIYNTPGMHNGVLVRGHHNIVERVIARDNQETGIQITGIQQEPFDMWPSYNQIISCESYNNADVARNDADGFAAKLTVGEGNRFVNCIAHHNVDDGYDLYAKSTTGSIGAVTIENSIAYANGKTEHDSEEIKPGDGNGFKLGGESMPGKHILRNCVSFNNLADGITCNYGPDCRIYNSITYGNDEVNFALFTNAKQSDWEVEGVVSYRGGEDDAIGYKNQGEIDFLRNRVFLNGPLGIGEVDSSWFESLDFVKPRFDGGGNIDMGDFLRLRSDSPAGAHPGLGSSPARAPIALKKQIGK